MDILISALGVVAGLLLGFSFQRKRPALSALMFVIVGIHLWFLVSDVGDRIVPDEPRSQAPWWEPSDDGVSWQPSDDEVRN